MAQNELKEIYLYHGDKIEPTKLHLISAFEYQGDKFIIYQATEKPKYARILPGNIFEVDTKNQYLNIAKDYIKILQRKKRNTAYKDITKQIEGQNFINQKAFSEKDENDRAVTYHPMSFYALDNGVIRKYSGKGIRIVDDIYLNDVTNKTVNIPENIVASGYKAIIQYLKEHEIEQIVFFVKDTISDIEYYRNEGNRNYLRLHHPISVIDTYDYENESNNLLLNPLPEEEKAPITLTEETMPKKEIFYALDGMELKKQIGDIVYQNGCYHISNVTFLESIPTISIEAARKYIIAHEENDVKFIPDFMAASFETDHTISCNTMETIKGLTIQNPVSETSKIVEINPPVEIKQDDHKKELQEYYTLENKRLQKYLGHIELIDGEYHVNDSQFIEEYEVESKEEAKRYIANHITEAEVKFIPDSLSSTFISGNHFICDEIESIKRDEKFYALTEEGIVQYRAELEKKDGKSYYTNITIQAIQPYPAGVNKSNNEVIEAYIREEKNDVLLYHGDNRLLQHYDSQIELEQFHSIKPRRERIKEENEKALLYTPYRNGDSIILEKSEAIILSKDPFRFEITKHYPGFEKEMFETKEQEQIFYQELKKRTPDKDVYVLNERMYVKSIDGDKRKYHQEQLIFADPKKIQIYTQNPINHTTSEEESIQQLAERRKKDLEELQPLVTKFQKDKSTLNNPKVEETTEKDIDSTSILKTEESTATTSKNISYNFSNDFFKKYPDQVSIYFAIKIYEEQGLTKEQIINKLPELQQLYNKPVEILTPTKIKR